MWQPLREYFIWRPYVGEIVILIFDIVLGDIVATRHSATLPSSGE